MSDELRVKVAKIFCADQNGSWPECVCSTKQALDCPECLMHADAAIALARAETLEEAAEAVAAWQFSGAKGSAATVIRAMKGSPWKCPIKYPGCTSNCGSYGCGN